MQNGIYWREFICLMLLKTLLTPSANQCNNPPTLPNGRVTYIDDVYVIYTCDPGHSMDVERDKVVLLCNTSSGEWSGALPNCNRIQCPAPAEPNFGSVEGNGHYYGDSVFFSCDSKYRLTEDSETSTCTELGKWSEETPTCSPDLSNPLVCPSGSWNYQNQTCFVAYNDREDWWGARAICATVSPDIPYGHLAKIPDQATQDFIVERLQTGRNYWIGVFEGLKWYWEGSASEILFFAWADGEPNGEIDSEICIEFYGQSNNYGWNDAGCRDTNFFICEFAVVTFILHEGKPYGILL
ncbi:sushi, von Willebrand factor type A, EGF and pentraxin domain-containing protein 1-like [Lytechinus variegatus]|uniref:sushi, von Willebrand factor type A, EGF and pentraxin domain-containing protein 1-like n=1 Tax=Lytechinus variegatus TaxID=7654 RepID=UPI001BB1D7C8|nr:sushi, von Willebrand factor type A, EGF and pentraxin domain-containing protein 1-like [Lytechinus variegatus]